MATIE